MIKTSKYPTGSILIWTVLLGICLMTAFFYFSQRLSLNAATQRTSIENQNARQFLESYAHYLETLPKEALESGQINYEGITGFLTNISSQITGILDVDQAIVYEVKYGKAKVEWANCAQKEVGRTLLIQPSEGAAIGNCVSFEYDGVSEVFSSPFVLTAGEAPVSYRITPLSNAILYNNQWTMDLKIMTPSKKIISIHRIFTPN